MIYTSMTKKAMKLAFDTHKEQVDKTGLPYIFHPFYLATQMDSEESVTVALLHDVVEDGDVSFSDLEKMGFSLNVIDALKLLTHDLSVDYMDYVRQISTNALAKKVKLADLSHNSDLSRLDHITEFDLTRQKKYLEAIKILSGE